MISWEYSCISIQGDKNSPICVSVTPCEKVSKNMKKICFYLSIYIVRLGDITTYIYTVPMTCDVLYQSLSCSESLSNQSFTWSHPPDSTWLNKLHWQSKRNLWRQVNIFSSGRIKTLNWHLNTPSSWATWYNSVRCFMFLCNPKNDYRDILLQHRYNSVKLQQINTKHTANYALVCGCLNFPACLSSTVYAPWCRRIV